MTDVSDRALVAHRHIPADEDDVRSPELVRGREIGPEQWERFERYAAAPLSQNQQQPNDQHHRHAARQPHDVHHHRAVFSRRRIVVVAVKH